MQNGLKNYIEMVWAYIIGSLLDYTQKKYKGHRMIPAFVMKKKTVKRKRRLKNLIKILKSNNNNRLILYFSV